MSIGEPVPNWFIAMTTYMGYAILFVLGYVRDFFGAIFKKKKYLPPEGYAPLLLDFEDFYTRRLYFRIRDAWNRPICSCPGAFIDVMDRTSDDHNKTIRFSGKIKHCMNLGSYNYLGFGDPDSPTKSAVFEALDHFGVSTCSTRMALGTTTLHHQLEKLVARFVRKPAALVFGMGFGTNSTGIPGLIGKGGLILSDSNNHSSIVTGARTSGAAIKVFKHNDPNDLENVVRRAIVEGQPRTHRPWTKILIMVEGIYSMEGEMCPLPDIVRIKKKYGCYLYVDEAHSIGALGKTGRGICEYTGVNTDDVDVLMGTFTKSFGAVGGYIAGSKDLVTYLRHSCAGSIYSANISPPAAQQVISAMKIIMGEDGTDLGKRKLQSLRNNANMFRARCIDMGLHVLGDWDSPIVPIMLYNAAKIIAFSRECYAEDLAVVVVGFPASPLLLSRARICISAAHDKKDLEEALAKIEKVADRVCIKYDKRLTG